MFGVWRHQSALVEHQHPPVFYMTPPFQFTGGNRERDRSSIVSGGRSHVFPSLRRLPDTRVSVYTIIPTQLAEGYPVIFSFHGPSPNHKREKGEREEAYPLHTPLTPIGHHPRQRHKQNLLSLPYASLV